MNIPVHTVCCVQVHLYNSICLKSARDDVLEIPPQTVLAYSVSELNITSDGHYG